MLRPGFVALESSRTILAQLGFLEQRERLAEWASLAERPEGLCGRQVALDLANMACFSQRPCRGWQQRALGVEPFRFVITFQSRQNSPAWSP